VSKIPSAAVEMDGVPSGRGGSRLFDGVKFFVSLKVPNRAALIEKIKVSLSAGPLRPSAQTVLTRVQSHGGSIAKLEKQATYLLGDRTRKDNPPGFISHALVEDSISLGELQDIEDYQLGPISGVSRSGKTTKTPFTQEDKDALLQFVKKKSENEVLALHGNELFKEWALEVRHQ
jgi:hypothetical protein